MKINYNISYSVFSNENKRIHVHFYVLHSKLSVARTTCIHSRAVHMHSPIILFLFTKQMRRILTFFTISSRTIFNEMLSGDVNRIWFLRCGALNLIIALLFLFIGLFVPFFIYLSATHSKYIIKKSSTDLIRKM